MFRHNTKYSWFKTFRVCKKIISLGNYMYTHHSKVIHVIIKWGIKRCKRFVLAYCTPFSTRIIKFHSLIKQKQLTPLIISQATCLWLDELHACDCTKCMLLISQLDNFRMLLLSENESFQLCCWSFTLQ